MQQHKTQGKMYKLETQIYLPSPECMYSINLWKYIHNVTQQAKMDGKEPQTVRWM